MTLIKKIKDKKVNFEFNKEYIKVVTDKIAANDALFITNSFKEMHPADAADIIEHLGQNERENLIKLNNFQINYQPLLYPYPQELEKLNLPLLMTFLIPLLFLKLLTMAQFQ